jgi:hypothetical protein
MRSSRSVYTLAFFCICVLEYVKLFASWRTDRHVAIRQSCPWLLWITLAVYGRRPLTPLLRCAVWFITVYLVQQWRQKVACTNFVPRTYTKLHSRTSGPSYPISSSCFLPCSDYYLDRWARSPTKSPVLLFLTFDITISALLVLF